MNTLTQQLHQPEITIATKLHQQHDAIENWFEQQWQQTPPPFYCSVDLRNAGYKLSPVDTNLFPAGFNNLDPTLLSIATRAATAAIKRACPTAKRVLLIPESHSRNVHYLENVKALQHIFDKAGFDARVGSLMADLKESTKIDLPSGESLEIAPLTRTGNRVAIGDFSPCLVLLNNDLSGQIPDIFKNIEQVIIPPLKMGWAKRLKSRHFQFYDNVSRAFAKDFDLDPWLIAPLFRYCGEINFMKREGEDCLARNVDVLVEAIGAKYQQYNIQQKPFVIIKADAGTYGMSVMTVHSGDEVRHLNRKQRTKMAKSKGGALVSRAIVQEGVYTAQTWGAAQAVAESVIYLMDQMVIGAFYRAHPSQSDDANLNMPGMEFHPYNTAEIQAQTGTDFYIYSIIARLAALAAAQEMRV